MKEMEHSETLKGVGVVLQGYHAAEKYELVLYFASSQRDVCDSKGCGRDSEADQLYHF